jgi:hypothetical protein
MVVFQELQELAKAPFARPTCRKANLDTLPINMASIPKRYLAGVFGATSMQRAPGWTFRAEERFWRNQTVWDRISSGEEKRPLQVCEVTTVGSTSSG